MFSATLKFSRIAPRKMRLVADIIRGKKVPAARKLLQFNAHRGAALLAKLLNSAVANATNQNPEIDTDNLYVKTIMVGDGVALRRIRPAPQGRAHPIKKRSSHTHIVLDLRGAPPRSGEPPRTGTREGVNKQPQLKEGKEIK